MDDLYVRLQKALDEAEERAHEARGRIVGGNWDVSRHHRRLAQVVERGALIAENLPNEIAEHIARWDPSTVLRLVGLFRALTAEHRWYVDDLSDGPATERCFRDDERWPCDEIKSLAEFWLTDTETADHRET